MALLLLFQGGKGSKYVNFDSEDVMSSLLWTHIRLLHPNILLREIINEAVGFEIIGSEELDYEHVTFEFWKKLPPPKLRSPHGRTEYGSSLPGFDFHKPLPKEGDTEADVFLHLGNKACGRRIDTVVMFEMKLHSPVSSRTSHDATRDQCARNYDVLANYLEKFEIYRGVFILWDNKELPEPLLLRTKNKHRESNIAVGWITYAKVLELIMKKLAVIQEQPSKGILLDLKGIMENIIARPQYQTTLFDFNEGRDRYEECY